MLVSTSGLAGGPGRFSALAVSYQSCIWQEEDTWEHRCTASN